MALRRLSSSSIYLKLAAPALVVVFILHVIGFSIPRWSTLSSNFTTYHVGLWQDCTCDSALSSNKCDCISKETLAGSVKVVQILETIGLIGLLVSWMTSLVLLFVKKDAIRNKGTLKILNIAIVLGSGICIVIGVIVYGFDCNENIEDLFSYVGDVVNVLELSNNRARLGVAFMLCTIVGGICVLVCTFLLVMDFCSAKKDIQNKHITYSNPYPFATHRAAFTNTDRSLVDSPSYIHSQYELQNDQIFQTTTYF